jgi:hypothetical protein
MSKRIAVALCACVLAACGGGKDDHVNAAAGTTFSYAEPQQSLSTPSSASDAIESLAAFQTSSDEATAMAVQGALMAVAFDAIPEDDFGLGGFAATTADPRALVRDARSRTFATAFGSATAATQFNGECTAVANAADGVTTVTFGNCQYTDVSADGSMTLTVNGKVVGRPGAVTWDVRYTVAFSSADARIAFAYHDVGDVAVTPATVVAHQEADIAASFSGGGQSASLALAQAVDLDVAIDSTCATKITGGTLEAKRVWTKRPSGASSTDVVNRGVLFSWTGCDLATVQFSR